jgi:hypothetical protein
MVKFGKGRGFGAGLEQVSKVNSISSDDCIAARRCLRRIAKGRAPRGPPAAAGCAPSSCAFSCHSLLGTHVQAGNGGDPGASTADRHDKVSCSYLCVADPGRALSPSPAGRHPPACRSGTTSKRGCSRPTATALPAAAAAQLERLPPPPRRSWALTSASHCLTSAAAWRLAAHVSEGGSAATRCDCTRSWHP